VVQLQQINQNEVNLVEMYYYKNFTQDEIAKKIFRSRSWVQQELQKIIEKLANL
jgi:RNA polymerase sigma factor (sigma-70 family)